MVSLFGKTLACLINPFTKLMRNFKIVTTLRGPTMGDRDRQPKNSKLSGGLSLLDAIFEFNNLEATFEQSARLSKKDNHFNSQ